MAITYYESGNNHIIQSLTNNSIFNNIKNYINSDLLPTFNYDLIILFTRMENLHNNNTYLNLIYDIRKISEYKTKKIEDYNPSPVVTIGLEDFVENLEFALENDEIGNQIQVVKDLNLDQRVKFVDSNIWHRYVPLDKDFKTNFEDVINDIVDNQKKELYQTSVAREFLEFKTRMMVNSYLAPVGIHAHATHLTPYRFHSESLMKLRFNKEKKKIIDKFKELRWKFLLIDDYDLYKLKKYNDQNNNRKKVDPPDHCSFQGIPTKACIMKTILEGILGENKVGIKEWKVSWDNDFEENNQSILLCVKSIEEAKEALKAEMFDMIFLDYLFTEDNNLGSEFLKDIQENEKLRNYIGPLEKFWIFPISAFSYAMMDDLRESGLGYYEDHWHISSGSDPINTPWLFKYKLMKFLKQQTRTSEKDISTFIKNNFKFKKDISESSKNCYSSLISLLKDHYSFINDRDKSFLAKSILIFIKSNNSHNHIWEHLRHLLYLLAFGSPTDWSEMWEEFTFIKNYLIEYKNLPYLESYTRRIQDYIIKLQKEYR